MPDKELADRKNWRRDTLLLSGMLYALLLVSTEPSTGGEQLRIVDV